jgi:hypothetical protein
MLGMWNVKINVIPVITGATGTVSKSFRKYLSYRPGKHEIIQALQQTAILGTAHIYFGKYLCTYVTLRCVCETTAAV